jgi:hypothetical protein
VGDPGELTTERLRRQLRHNDLHVVLSELPNNDKKKKLSAALRTLVSRSSSLRSHSKSL